MKIRELSISARARMCLLTAGYEDIEELRDITDEELLEIRNLNVKGVTEIRAAIEAYFIEEEDESEKDLEDEFKDITIFQRDENIGVTVDFCGLEFDAVSESITISIWVSNKSEDTYDIWIKDLHINGKSHKDFCDIGSVSDYSSGYLEEEIDDIDYEKIQTIRFLVEIDDEDDNELANSKIVTLSCNTEDESFTVESIADYEEEADISEDEDIVDDFEKKFTKEEENSEGNCKDNTIFRRDGVIVEICGIKLDSLSKTISIGIWTDNESVDTYKIRLKDLYINEKLSKYFNDIEQSISAYGCAYIEGRIEETNNIAYEEIQRIKFLVEIDYEADKELSNSKIVTLSCNTEDESFTVESIADYEEKADIFKEEDTVDVLGENSVDEWLRPAVEMYKASLRGLSKNQNNQNCVLAAYPDIIKNIVRKREKYWEYRLYVEIVIYEYENLREYRNQKVVFGKYEDCLKRIEDSNEFVDFIKSQMDKLLDFIRKIESYVNEDLKEAFGKSGEAGDVHKIIEATEKMMQIYKDMIEWKLSFGNIDADCTCSRMVELLCQVVESALENFDVLYSKMQVAKKQFEDLLAGLITEEELHVDISIPIVVELDEFSKKWNAWTEKYLNI